MMKCFTEEAACDNEAQMKLQTKVAVTILSLLTPSMCLAGTGTEPLSNIPAEQREVLGKRLGTYVEAYRDRKWDKLYDLVSDTGKGGTDKKTFVAAMTSEHGKNFAQMPDLLEFKPDRTEESNDGFDIYGCGKAQREGAMFNGIVVVHAVPEHNGWSFTGWTFTEFPNEPCKGLADPKWQPENRMKWNSAMEEVAHFKSQGVPFHVDAPR
jgi:hypothetical protein